jgi:hypothetical protein
MTNDLLQRIQQAQVQAGEDAMVDDLRRKGLLPPSSPKLGITIDYSEWRLLLREFIDEVAGHDADLKVTMEWTMETWLQWLRKRQETTNEHPNGTTNLRLVTPAD